MTDDMVVHPAHYTAHPSGVEIWDIIGHMHTPLMANAFKYVARHTLKGKRIEDLRKAIQYVEKESNRRKFCYPTYSNPRARGSLVYRPEDAAFYTFLAGEPSEGLQRLYVMIWNVDRSDDPATQWDELDNIVRFLAIMIREYEADNAKSRENEAEALGSKYPQSRWFAIRACEVAEDMHHLCTGLYDVRIGPDPMTIAGADWRTRQNTEPGGLYLKVSDEDGGETYRFTPKQRMELRRNTIPEEGI